MLTGRQKRFATSAVLAALLLGVTYYALFRIAQPGSTHEGQRWLLPSLSLTLVVLTLGMAGVLIRKLVKLIVEHRRGVLGSRLRIKLVFFFLALVLLPAIVLFSGSAHIIKQTVESIFETSATHLRHGDTIVSAWREYFSDEGSRRAQALAQEILERGVLDPSRRAELAALLERSVQRGQLRMARVVVGGRRIASAESLVEPALRAELERLVDGIIAEAESEGLPLTRLDRLGGGLVARAAVPLPPPRDEDGAAGVVAVALTLPDGIAASLKTIDEAVTSYQRLRLERRDLVRLYVTLIGLIFIATLFVATWIGWYVARRITEPIQEVAAAAREISAGNMDVRVRTRVGDEMAMLVDSFNEMAGELQENREVISRSTAELRRSNQALEERRRYIETLVANLSTAVISLDSSGAVKTANPAVERILGVVLRAGDRAEEVLVGRGLQPLADLLRRAPGAASVSLRRDLVLPEEARAQHVSVQLSPLLGRMGENLGDLVMVEDLSDVLRAQKALAWQEVARRIAHEIKNPLTPIQLSAQRLRKKFFAKSDDLDQVLLEATASIEHEVAGLKQLVDEFSLFARMPQIAPQSVELSGVVESVLALYKGVGGIEWRVDLDPSVGRVLLDAQQLRRALINLIDNAAAAMDERGTIHVATRALGADGSVRIEIADTGPGIEPADRDKLFAPYFSTKKRGTGLGLAIVHKVVTDHRGTIRVEDAPGGGARFVIEFPGGSIVQSEAGRSSGRGPVRERGPARG